MRAILTLLLTLFGLFVKAQFPVVAPMGGKHQLVNYKGGIKADSGIVTAIYPDTTAANLAHIWAYPGALIVASGKLQMRSTDGTRWEAVVGGSGDTSFTAMHGDYLYSVQYREGGKDSVAVVGPASASATGFMTNGIQSIGGDKEFTAGLYMNGTFYQTSDVAEVIFNTHKGLVYPSSSVTLNRPGTISGRHHRWNEDSAHFEGYDGAGWKQIAWKSDITAGFTNPMTTAGDFIVGGSGGAASRLGIGAAGTWLSSNGTTASWSAPPWIENSNASLTGVNRSITVNESGSMSFIADDGAGSTLTDRTGWGSGYLEKNVAINDVENGLKAGVKFNSPGFSISRQGADTAYISSTDKDYGSGGLNIYANDRLLISGGKTGNALYHPKLLFDNGADGSGFAGLTQQKPNGTVNTIQLSPDEGVDYDGVMGIRSSKGDNTGFVSVTPNVVNLYTVSETSKDAGVIVSSGTDSSTVTLSGQYLDYIGRTRYRVPSLFEEYTQDITTGKDSARAFYLLGTITANRTITITDGTATGEEITITNTNDSAYTWAVSGAVKNLNETSVTEVPNKSFMRLRWLRGAWYRIGSDFDIMPMDKSYQDRQAFYKLAGLDIKAETFGMSPMDATNAVSMSNNALYLMAMPIYKTKTVAGVNFFMRTTGNYEAGTRHSGVTLYKWNGDNTASLIAYSTSDPNWVNTGVKTPGWYAIPFDNVAAGQSLTIQPGIYYVGVSWSSTSSTTTPALPGTAALTNSVLSSLCYGSSFKASVSTSANSSSTPLSTITLSTYLNQRIYLSLY